MRVRYKPRVIEAEELGENPDKPGGWAITDPILGIRIIRDSDFRAVYENEFDNIALTPQGLTEQLSQELQRWGMTPLPLDVPIEATLALTLAAVRQITFDIERVTQFAHAKDIRRELEELINC